jgi:hypothetical protein
MDQKKKTQQGAKGGVGVILSPELANHCKNGKNKLLTGGSSAGGTTRFMSVTIKLKKLAKTRKKVICKYHNLVLIPYYAPPPLWIQRRRNRENDPRIF